MEKENEQPKVFKTPEKHLILIRKYQEEHREEINRKSKEKYSRLKNTPEMIEKLKEYRRRGEEKRRLKKAQIVKEEKKIQNARLYP